MLHGVTEFWWKSIIDDQLPIFGGIFEFWRDLNFLEGFLRPIKVLQFWWEIGGLWLTNKEELHFWKEIQIDFTINTALS